MAHFWEHTATQDGTIITLLRFCQCGAVQTLAPVATDQRDWQEMVKGVPESQCGEYERRLPHTKDTE